MKLRNFVLVALILGLAIPVVAFVNSPAGGDQAKKVAKILKGTKISMATAIKTAEDKTKGKAFGAKLEVEKGVTKLTVLTLVDGDTPKIMEVEVNAVDGKVIEVEEEGGEDDKDDDDKEHENEDEDDDDDKDEKDDD